MCCLFTILLLLGPRVAGIVWWIAAPLRWVSSAGAFDTWLWPVLGIIFLPWLTLMYVIVSPGGIVGLDWLFLGIALIADIGMYAGGGYGNRNSMPGVSG